MSSMESNDFKPVIIEIAEIGKEVVKLVLNSEEELKEWIERPPESK